MAEYKWGAQSKMRKKDGMIDSGMNRGTRINLWKNKRTKDKDRIFYVKAVESAEII